jgi:hypothetical protein
MLLSKFVYKSFDVICLGPNAWHDDVTRRTIEHATPRAVVVVVNSVIGNRIDLRMLGDKICIEGINCRVRLDATSVALAQAPIELSGFAVRESLIREPYTEITAHKAFPVTSFAPTLASRTTSATFCL